MVIQETHNNIEALYLHWQKTGYVCLIENNTIKDISRTGIELKVDVTEDDLLHLGRIVKAVGRPLPITIKHKDYELLGLLEEYTKEHKQIGITWMVEKKV